MKIIKFSLPVIAVVAVLSMLADQGIQDQIRKSADAGALPEATVLFDKMYTQPRLAKAQAEARAKNKLGGTRLAVANTTR